MYLWVKVGDVLELSSLQTYPSACFLIFSLPLALSVASCIA